MKKCSTATLAQQTARAACKALLAMLLAQMPALSAQGATICEWASDAPDQHHVQRGDTLWAIASVFLKNPWCWPQVWGSNRDTIRDPHWIYPGQLILLDRVRGVLHMREAERDAYLYPSFRLSPSLRSLALEQAPIPVISSQLLRMGEAERDAYPYLSLRMSPSLRSQPLERAPIPVISSQLLRMLSRIRLLDSPLSEGAPVISGISESRKLAAEGDIIFVRGQLGSSLHFDVVRPSMPVIDPDSHQILGTVSQHVGRAQLRARGTLSHRFIVTSSKAELQTGDRLLPVSQAARSPASIHASQAPAGKLAAILHEGRWAGPNDMVVINRGAEHGLSAGSVVRVARHVRIRADEPPQSNLVPEEPQPVALLLVLDVADRMSLAVVTRSRDTVTVGDIVLPP